MSDAPKGGRYFGPARFFLAGDRVLAQRHISEARMLLGYMRDQHALGGPAFQVQHLTLTDGTTIRGVMNNGLFQAEVIGMPVRGGRRMRTPILLVFLRPGGTTVYDPEADEFRDSEPYSRYSTWYGNHTLEDGVAAPIFATPLFESQWNGSSDTTEYIYSYGHEYNRSVSIAPVRGLRGTLQLDGTPLWLRAVGVSAPFTWEFRVGDVGDTSSSPVGTNVSGVRDWRFNADGDQVASFGIQFGTPKFPITVGALAQDEYGVWSMAFRSVAKPVPAPISGHTVTIDEGANIGVVGFAEDGALTFGTVYRDLYTEGSASLTTTATTTFKYSILLNREDPETLEVTQETLATSESVASVTQAVWDGCATITAYDVYTGAIVSLYTYWGSPREKIIVYTKRTETIESVQTGFCGTSYISTVVYEYMVATKNPAVTMTSVTRSEWTDPNWATDPAAAYPYVSGIAYANPLGDGRATAIIRLGTVGSFLVKVGADETVVEPLPDRGVDNNIARIGLCAGQPKEVI